MVGIQVVGVGMQVVGAVGTLVVGVGSFGTLVVGEKLLVALEQ